MPEMIQFTDHVVDRQQQEITNLRELLKQNAETIEKLTFENAWLKSLVQKDV